MSTLRISNIEAKADSSSPTVDEQLKFTNSDGDVLLHLDGRTAGITTVGINTTNQTIKFDANNNILITGIVTATEFHGSLAVGTSVTYGDNEKAYFGTGLDLELFHNGTNSVINNTEGALLFQNNGSSSMYIASDGQVSLNNDITFVGASANALWDKSENYFLIPDSIVHSGDTDTKIRFPSNDTITFETNGDQALEITSGGGVKFNDADTPGSTTAPAQILNHSGGWQFYGSSAEGTHRNIIFGTNDRSAGERLRIDSSGRVIIANGGSGGTADTNADNFVVKNYTSSGSCGISILNVDNENSTLYFGNASDNKHAEVVWSDAANLFLIGTSNAGAAIKFRTANQSDAMGIDSSGKVGLGINSPARKLHLHETGNNTAVYATFTNGTTGVAANNGFTLGIDSSADAIFNNYSNTDIITICNGAERLRIDSSGNVGIGSAIPAAKLDVVGGIKADGIVTIDNSSSPTIQLTSNSTTGDCRLFFGDPDSNLVGRFSYVHNGDYFSFYAAYGERFRIAGNGDITVTSIDANATGPTLKLFHNSASPAANDVVSRISMFGDDAAGNETEYGRIETVIDSTTDSQETGHINFGTRGLGSFANVFRIKRRSTATSPTGEYTADDADGIILDVYNTGNPYPRYMSLIAKSAGNTDSNISLWTEAVGGSPTEKLRITSAGLVQTIARSAEVRRMILSGSPTNSAFNIEAHDGETGASSGDVQGKLGLFYNDGSTLTNTACISFERGSGAADGAMTFVTNQAERLRIQSDGVIVPKEKVMGTHPFLFGGFGSIASNQGCRITGGTGSHPACLSFDGGGTPTLEMGSTTNQTIIGSNSYNNSPMNFKSGMSIATLSGGTTRFQINSNGNIGAPTGNNIYNASDERLKENMVELTDGLSKIQKLKPISFTWKEGWDVNLDGKKEYGFGAQTTEAVDEMLVEPFSLDDAELNGEIIEKPLRVNEKYIIPLLVKAIQELSAKVAALEGS